MSHLVQFSPAQGSREELEHHVHALANEGTPVTYLGLLGDNEAPMHVWRIGPAEDPVNPAYVPPPVAEKARRADKSVIYRRDLYTGSGEPVGPVDFSRPVPEKILVDFPEPLIRATGAHEGTAVPPAPVTDLETYAQALGWDTMITYAKGWTPHATHGTPSAQPKESWAVRMRRGGDRAVAVRMAGTWASMWTWSGADTFKHHNGLAPFKEAIA